jgi:NAD(P)H-nitrite reductase large subunit
VYQQSAALKLIAPSPLSTRLQLQRPLHQACTGCGGCEPLVKNIFTATMASLGQTVSKNLCEHFAYSRNELYQIAKVSGATTFKEMLHSHGHVS